MKGIIDHPLFAISSYLIGLVGIYLSVIFYRKSKHNKRLGFYFQNFGLINRELKSHQKITVLFENKRLDNLVVTDLYLWNYGNVLIQEDDLVKTVPIEFKSDGGLILDAIIDKVIDESNSWTLSYTNERMRINFDYIEPKQGVRIKIYHTGSKMIGNGKLKGGGFAYKPVMPIKKDRSEINKQKIFIVVLSITTITSFIFGYFLDKGNLLALSYVLVLMTLISIYLTYREIQEQKKPTVFDDFRYGRP